MNQPNKTLEQIVAEYLGLRPGTEITVTVTVTRTGTVEMTEEQERAARAEQELAERAEQQAAIDRENLLTRRRHRADLNAAMDRVEDASRRLRGVQGIDEEAVAHVEEVFGHLCTVQAALCHSEERDALASTNMTYSRKFEEQHQWFQERVRRESKGDPNLRVALRKYRNDVQELAAATRAWQTSHTL